MPTPRSGNVMTALVDGCGRGFTVLCTVPDATFLGALASLAGPTGLVLAAGPEPPTGPGWAAVRCDPAAGIPLRSHIVDAAVLLQTPDLPRLAEEARRTLVPDGDVCVLLNGDADAAAAMADASIRTLAVTASGVLVGRGP